MDILTNFSDLPNGRYHFADTLDGIKAARGRGVYVKDGKIGAYGLPIKYKYGLLISSKSAIRRARF